MVEKLTAQKSTSTKAKAAMPDQKLLPKVVANLGMKRSRPRETEPRNQRFRNRHTDKFRAKLPLAVVQPSLALWKFNNSPNELTSLFRKRIWTAYLRALSMKMVQSQGRRIEMQMMLLIRAPAVCKTLNWASISRAANKQTRSSLSRSESAVEFVSCSI
jgi:hypothetical protein